MFHRFVLILAFACIATQPSQARVFSETSSLGIKADGSFERGGTLTLRIEDDDFPFASESSPIFLRLRVDSGALLAQTLVDIVPDGGTPINLPIRLETPREGVQVVAPENAIQIVRWREGEWDIWLKINHPTNTFISINDTAGAPTVDDSVSITLGHGGDTPYLYPGTAAVLTGEANLAFPERANTGEPVTTPLYLDLSGALIDEEPSSNRCGDKVCFDFLALDDNTIGIETAPAPFGIFLGPVVFVSFTGSSRDIGFFDGYRSVRWLSHITRLTGGFTSALILDNPIGFDRTLNLTFRRENGSILGVHRVEIDGRSVMRIEPSELADLFGEQPSHIQVEGHGGVGVSVEYAPSASEGVVAHTLATDATSTFFTVYPARDQNFIGLAAVNLGTEDATIELSWLAPNGVESERLSLSMDTDFPVLSKRLWVLNDLIPNDALAVRLYSDQRLSTVFLGGNNLPDSGPTALFQVVPVTNLQ